MIQTITEPTQIPVSPGHFAIVDSSDVTIVSKYKWRLLSRAANNRYAITKRCGSTIYMHRLIMGAAKGSLVDHRNRNTLDNRRCNLRICSQQQNQANRGRTRRNSASQYKGVGRHHSGKWVAYIGSNYKTRNLGVFDTEIEAALAYNHAALKIWGEFACVNLLKAQVNFNDSDHHLSPCR